MRNQDGNDLSDPHLLAIEYESLLSRGNALLLLDLFFDIHNLTSERVSRLLLHCHQERADLVGRLNVQLDLRVSAMHVGLVSDIVLAGNH